MYEAIVIGGGPAGLQAALTLGRMHRRTLLIDSGEYRNATVSHAHNLLTNDGAPPARIRAAARAELDAYPTVEVRDARVVTVRADGPGFTFELADGSRLTSARVLLATGVRDELPPIPGLAEEWGRRVAQCPFCHGHEFAGREVVVALEGEHASMIARMLRPIASSVTVVPPAAIARVAGSDHDDELRIDLHDGGRIAAAGVFLAPTPHQRAPFAAQLGCRLLPSGGVEIDPVGQTSVAGVYAAGDMAHAASAPGPMVSLAAAIAAGQLAAAGIVRDLIATEA